ncbi:MAG TPA: hypothetical protein VNH11_30530 [Pirellulales bacterium]|nr:hypothetical protein [Pirellulales bacterium]
MRRLLLWFAPWAVFVGCDSAAPLPTPTSGSEETAKIEQANDILAYISGLLNGLAQYDAVNSDVQDFFDLNETARHALESGVPPALVSQLNQWMTLQTPLADWRRGPLLERLPERLKKLPQLQELDAMGFARADGIDLREAVWMRDASNWAAGTTQNDLERARRLFDWIVRNIQLESSDEGQSATPTRLAWQTLLLGRGPAIDRAWVFILMARQQGLDVVMLSRPAAADAEEASPRPWVPALLDKGELYLFEPSLGLPVPGPNGEGIATLAQVAADEALLRHLDLDDDHRYEMDAAGVQNMLALIEASPIYLTQRAALLESELTGDQKMVLSVDASAVAERVKKCKHVKDVELWSLPYERLAGQAKLGKTGLQRLAADFEPFVVPFPRTLKKKAEIVPALWKGRVLHLMGHFSGDEGAMHYYQIARPSESEIANGPAIPQQEGERLRGKVAPEEWQQTANRYIQLAHVAKHDASYWLGLIAYERENYKTAADHLAKRTLDVDAQSPWRAGALYNLARAEEALGLTEDAREVYRQIESPQRHGNLLRARWLAEKEGR